MYDHTKIIADEKKEEKKDSGGGTTDYTNAKNLTKTALNGIETPKVNPDGAEMQKAFNTVFLWAGIICVIVIIFAGIQYTLSVGNPNKIATAKKTLLFAVTGISFVILAFAIVNYIIGRI